MSICHACTCLVPVEARFQSNKFKRILVFCFGKKFMCMGVLPVFVCLRVSITVRRHHDDNNFLLLNKKYIRNKFL